MNYLLYNPLLQRCYKDTTLFDTQTASTDNYFFRTPFPHLFVAQKTARNVHFAHGKKGFYHHDSCKKENKKTKKSYYLQNFYYLCEEETYPSTPPQRGENKMINK